MTDDSFLRAVVDRRDRPALWAASWGARTPEEHARARMVRLAPASRSQPADLAVLEATHGLGGSLRSATRRVRWAEVRPTGEVARFRGHDEVDHPGPPITRVCPVDFPGMSGVATATDSGRDGIRVWLPSAEDPVVTITRTGDDVRALAGLRSGGATLLAAGLRDGRVLVWRLALAFVLVGDDGDDGDGDGVPRVTGADRPILTLDLGAPVTAMCALPGPAGDRLACGGADGRVTVWSAVGTVVGGFGAHGGAVRAMAALGHDRLVTAGADDAVRVWDGTSGTPYDELAAPGVRTLGAWGSTVAFAGPEAVTLWSVDTGDVRAFAAPGRTALCPMPVGETVLLAEAGEEIHFRDPASGAMSGPWGAPSFNEAWCTYAEAACTVRVGGDLLLATGGRDGGLRLYDPTGGIPVPGPSRAADGLCLLHVDGRPYAVAVGDSGLRFWDAETGAASGAIELEGAPHDVCVVSLPGRTLLACAGPGPLLRLVDPYQGAVVRQLDGHAGAVGRVCAVTVDGQAMLASTGADGTVRLWDPIAESPGRVLFTGRTPVDAITAVPADGREILAYAIFEKVLLLDPSDGQVRATLEGCGANGLTVFERDGRTMLAGAPFEHRAVSVHIWDVAAALKEEGPVPPVAVCGGQVLRSEDVSTVDMDGRTLIVAVHADQWVTLTLWDPAEPATPLRDHALFQAARRVVSPAAGTLIVGLANGVLTFDLG